MNDECTCDWCAKGHALLLACENVEPYARPSTPPLIGQIKMPEPDATHMYGVIENAGAVTATCHSLTVNGKPVLNFQARELKPGEQYYLERVTDGWVIVTDTPAATYDPGSQRRLQGLEPATPAMIENTDTAAVREALEYWHAEALALRYRYFRECFRTGTPLAYPASDTAPKPVGESWPIDQLHDAAKKIIREAKNLVPEARQKVQEATKPDPTPTGRAASDGALGRALGSRHTSYGLRVGV